MSLRYRYRLGVGLIALLLMSLDVDAQESSEIAPEAREYLEHALQIMEAEALNRGKVDWEQIRADAFVAAAGAKSTSDTHSAVTAAVWALNDNHSRFIPPVSALPEELRMVMAAQTSAEPEARRINKRVGYVRVPAFSGPNPTEFAEAIAELVFEVDALDVCAWVVDVRGNTGGNMWPMLQGLYPILGEGVPGYFVGADESWTPWSIDTEVIGARTLARGEPAVAVLHDGETASSGEAVVVAFRGRPQTRSFGQGTAGLSTANKTIVMADGAKMLLAVSVFADRNRDTYGTVIAPDELLPEDAPEEQVLAIAEDWIHQQPSCSAP